MKRMDVVAKVLSLRCYCRCRSVFSWATKIKVLYNFGSSNDGNDPTGPPILAPSGNLYGMTGGGPGQNGNGVVYKLTKRAKGKWEESIPHKFAAHSDGALPWGNPVFDKTGVVELHLNAGRSDDLRST